MYNYVLRKLLFIVYSRTIIYPNLDILLYIYIAILSDSDDIWLRLQSVLHLNKLMKKKISQQLRINHI